MITGTEQATAAMARHETAQEVYARNLANVMTPGFKRVITSFRTILEGQTSQADGSAPQGEDFAIDFSQGTLTPTGQTYDLAVVGKGLFVIQTANGLRYTRDGSFHVNANGDLLTAGGDAVLGNSGPVTVPDGTRRVDIMLDGSVRADGAVVNQIRLTCVQDPQTLLPAGGNLFAPTPGTTTLLPATDSTIRQGFIESSNVSPVQEMVAMMANYRSYEACSRSIRAIQQSEDRLYQIV